MKWNVTNLRAGAHQSRIHALPPRSMKASTQLLHAPAEAWFTWIQAMAQPVLSRLFLCSQGPSAAPAPRVAAASLG